jgi:hypothetical protein
LPGVLAADTWTSFPLKVETLIAPEVLLTKIC